MAQRSDVMARCANQIADLSQMKNGAFFDVAELSDLEDKFSSNATLSAGNSATQSGSGVFINKDQTCSFRSTKDHLRIQFLKTGLVCVRSGSRSTDLILAWKMARPRFSSEFGYLTACPTNLRPTCLCNVTSAWTRNF